MTPWERLQHLAADSGVAVSDQFCADCERFHALLVDTNRQLNLTRIVDPAEAVIKHYLDSLLFLAVWPSQYNHAGLKVLDVGSGAGLPGIPLALARPEWNLTLLDSVGKKVKFIQSAIATLGLAHAQALQGRCEDLASRPPHREAYDVVTARAVAGMPELLELCLPFLRTGGVLIVSKGSKGPEELEQAMPALSVLRGRVINTRHFHLPAEAGERYLYVIEKHAATPREYPRRAGLPHREPIHQKLKSSPATG